MILLSLLDSVEFYVIMLFVGAAIVAFFARPRSTGPARQYLLGSELSMVPGNDFPAIDLRVLDDGAVVLTRTGLDHVTESGAVSMAVEVAGFDIEIKERVVRSADPAWPVNTATFRLDFLAPERYHIHYVNPDTNLTTATALRVKPGIHISKPLQ